MSTAIQIILLVAFFAGFMLWLKRERQKDKSQEAQVAEDRLQMLFKNLSTDILEQSRLKLLESNEERLKHQEQQQRMLLELQKKEVESVVKPLAESLAHFQKDSSEANDKRHKEYGSLDKMLKMMLDSSDALRNETTKLAGALKSPGVQGRWGELQLKRVVELAGMMEYCDFSEQSSQQNDSDAKRIRPDLIVHLPSKRQIIVDAKAVLSGYLEAEAATDEQLRQMALERHANSLRTRVQELSRKSYWEQFEQAPDFVVLFIPGEVFFSAAVQVQPGLVEYAFEQKVVMATPSTLMALLKAVAYGWRQEQLAENARKISDEASRVYQALAVWNNHLAGMGQGLEKATKSFNQAVGSLERTVLPPLRRMKDLGVSAKSEPAELNPVELAVREPSARYLEELESLKEEKKSLLDKAAELSKS